ncbi:sugar phosphate isomerase/epimerase [Haladaptatus sp. AB643]|uniref:sugar phosphate isomerase/epimerase family protein n=1 Tax=Haladaptatus sp. AB643 TaxID=2934174 RepID=UPI00209C5DF6|nr:sugar phosphate isomerase/epimerase [Haladaptatus sp. AB643]MCO8246674.1 sugar phosphate isomerase/epimerase [Haladaptatus sp. AB643]
MARPAVQLYSLRAVDEPLPELITSAGDAGFEGVEYANRIGDADTDAVMDALDGAGMESVAAHVGIEELEDDLEGTVEFYDSLDCDRLVVPWLDPEHFESEDAIDASADRLTSLADRVADHGVELGYHNHDHEFEAVDGRPAFERFAESSGDSLALEVDLGWASAAGVDPTGFLERWGDRIPLVHVSDADESRSPTEVGDGVLDVDACASAVDEAGVEWAIYEHDEPEDAMASLSHGGDVLQKF